MKAINYEQLSQDLLEYLLDLKDTHGLIELLVNMGYNSDDLIELGFDNDDILLSFDVLLKKENR